MRRLVWLAFLLAFAAPAAAADDTPPGIVYARGAKFDKSFNEAAYNGAERFKAETGIAYHEVEITNDGQRVQALSTLIRRGAPVVVAVGFDQRTAVETVAERFPQARLVIIDTVVDKPNVQSVVYREQEGAFLVGVLAAMASKSGTIGYLGGMDIPIIRRIGQGYAEGARWAVPGIAIVDNVTGTTPAAFVDPARGAELARTQFDRGALIKADGDDDRCAAPDQGRQGLYPLAVVGDLDLVIGDAGFRPEPLGAGIGRLVEGFVELRTLRIDDPGTGIVRGGGGGKRQ